MWSTKLLLMGFNTSNLEVLRSTFTFVWCGVGDMSIPEDQSLIKGYFGTVDTTMNYTDTNVPYNIIFFNKTPECQQLVTQNKVNLTYQFFTDTTYSTPMNLGDNQLPVMITQPDSTVNRYMYVYSRAALQTTILKYGMRIIVNGDWFDQDFISYHHNVSQVDYQIYYQIADTCPNQVARYEFRFKNSTSSTPFDSTKYESAELDIFGSWQSYKLSPAASQFFVIYDTFEQIYIDMKLFPTHLRWRLRSYNDSIDNKSLGLQNLTITPASFELDKILEIPGVDYSNITVTNYARNATIANGLFPTDHNGNPCDLRFGIGQYGKSFVVGHKPCKETYLWAEITYGLCTHYPGLAKPLSVHICGPRNKPTSTRLLLPEILNNPSFSYVNANGSHPIIQNSAQELVFDIYPNLSPGPSVLISTVGWAQGDDPANTTGELNCTHYTSIFYPDPLVNPVRQPDNEIGSSECNAFSTISPTPVSKPWNSVNYPLTDGSWIAGPVDPGGTMRLMQIYPDNWGNLSAPLEERRIKFCAIIHGDNCRCVFWRIRMHCTIPDLQLRQVSDNSLAQSLYKLVYDLSSMPTPLIGGFNITQLLTYLPSQCNLKSIKLFNVTDPTFNQVPVNFAAIPLEIQSNGSISLTGLQSSTLQNLNDNLFPQINFMINTSIPMSHRIEFEYTNIADKVASTVLELTVCGMEDIKPKAWFNPLDPLNPWNPEGFTRIISKGQILSELYDLNRFMSEFLIFIPFTLSNGVQANWVTQFECSLTSITLCMDENCTDPSQVYNSGNGKFIQVSGSNLLNLYFTKDYPNITDFWIKATTRGNISALVKIEIDQLDCAGSVVKLKNPNSYFELQVDKWIDGTNDIRIVLSKNDFFSYFDVNTPFNCPLDTMVIDNQSVDWINVDDGVGLVIDRRGIITGNVSFNLVAKNLLTQASLPVNLMFCGSEQIIDSPDFNNTIEVNFYSMDGIVEFGSAVLWRSMAHSDYITCPIKSFKGMRSTSPPSINTNLMVDNLNFVLTERDKEMLRWDPTKLLFQLVMKNYKPSIKVIEDLVIMITTKGNVQRAKYLKIVIQNKIPIETYTPVIKPPAYVSPKPVALNLTQVIVNTTLPVKKEEVDQDLEFQRYLNSLGQPVYPVIGEYVTRPGKKYIFNEKDYTFKQSFLGDKNKPISLKIKEILPDGNVTISFSERLFVPNFIQDIKKAMQKRQANKTKKDGRLLADDKYTDFEQLNVHEDIMETNVIFLRELEDSEKPITVYDVHLLDWTELNLTLNVNFSIPERISTGAQPELIYFKVRFPPMFTSQYSGRKPTNLKEKIAFPKPIPSLNPRKSYENIENLASKVMLVLVCTQAVLAFCMKKAMARMWRLFFFLQMVCGFQILSINYPYFINLLLDNFKMIIFFEILKPDKILPKLGIEFDLNAWINEKIGLAKAQLSDDEKETMMMNGQIPLEDEDTLIQLKILVAIIGAVVGILIIFFFLTSCIKKLRNKVVAIVKGIIQSFLWNNTCQSIIVSFFPQIIICIGSIQKNFYSGNKIPLKDLVTVGILVYTILWFFVVLCRNKDKFDENAFKLKYSFLYEGLKLPKNDQNVKQRFWNVIFLVRRLLFVAIPFVLFQQRVWQSLAVIHLFMLYSIWICHYMPYASGLINRILINNEFTLLLLGYHAFWLSISEDPLEETVASYSFVAVILLAIIANFHVILHESGFYRFVYLKYLKVRQFICIRYIKCKFQCKEWIAKKCSKPPIKWYRSKDGDWIGEERVKINGKSYLKIHRKVLDKNKDKHSTELDNVITVKGPDGTSLKFTILANGEKIGLLPYGEPFFITSPNGEKIPFDQVKLDEEGQMIAPNGDKLGQTEFVCKRRLVRKVIITTTSNKPEKTENTDHAPKALPINTLEMGADLNIEDSARRVVGKKKKKKKKKIELQDEPMIIEEDIANELKIIPKVKLEKLIPQEWIVEDPHHFEIYPSVLAKNKFTRLRHKKIIDDIEEMGPYQNLDEKKKKLFYSEKATREILCRAQIEFKDKATELCMQEIPGFKYEQASEKIRQEKSCEISSLEWEIAVTLELIQMLNINRMVYRL